MNTRFISPNLTIVLVTASIAACTVPGKDPLNLNQTSEDETPVTSSCSGSEAACLGQNVSGFTADAAPPVTRDAEWAESLEFEVDEVSEGVDADDADARERVEIELFPRPRSEPSCPTTSTPWVPTPSPPRSTTRRA